MAKYHMESKTSLIINATYFCLNIDNKIYSKKIPIRFDLILLNVLRPLFCALTLG